MSRICVIYNPSSGWSDSLDKIKQAFKKQVQTPKYIALSNDLPATVDQLFKEGYQLFVAAGGDGSVNAVATSVLSHSGAVLGVIPVGTLNHFAKDIGLPIDIDQAVALFKLQHTKLLDVGMVNDQPFLNNSSVGIYARIAKSRQRYDIWLLKWLVALLSGLRLLVYPPAYHYFLTLGGKSLHRHSPLIFVGNNRYDLSRVGFFNRQSLQGGKLCVYLVTSRNPLVLFGLSVAILFGRYGLRSFEEYDAPGLTLVSSRKRLSVAYDGEVRKMETPLRFKIMPKTLKVVVPG